MLLFDIETDGLLPEVSKIHCINAIDTETGQRLRFNNGTYSDGTPSTPDGTIDEGMALIEDADCVAGHNIIEYDLPVLRHVHPEFVYPRRVYDTRALSRLVYPNLADRDFSAVRAGRVPQDIVAEGLAGNHSLRAWGRRLGFDKGDFDPKDHGHTWATVPFMREMDEYCTRDVEVNLRLLGLLLSKEPEWGESFELENAVALIIARQMRKGVAFDSEAAKELVARLQVRRAELEQDCFELFEPWYVRDGREVFVPKRPNRTTGYVAGAPLSKVQRRVFNPGSRAHIADRLQKLYGWKPEDFTNDGKPKVDESVLAALPYPPAKLLSEYLMVDKRLGQLSDGQKAWLKLVRDDGRIYGTVNSNGAVTGRMTHNGPNLAQVPQSKSPYGKECRSLFTVPPGYKMVGSDADGLELRMLAHYMAPLDGGEYMRAVVSGRKEDETDVHNINKKAVGLNKRDSAKTFVYALIYGAQGYTLGLTVFEDFTDAQRERFLQKHPTRSEQEAALKKLGESRKRRLMERLPALKQLIDGVKKAAQARGYLIGLDGRKLYVRSQHSALNTLLQGGGAVVMKRALVIADQRLRELGELTWEVDGEFVLNVHDEFQSEVLEKHAHTVGRVMADSIRAAGEHYNLRCPLDAGYDVGDNWSETH